MKTLIVIPARYKSSRFPGKPLAKILGKTMIEWVADIGVKTVGLQNVYIATENNKIHNFVRSVGYNSILTSKNCLTGTDRVAEVAKKIKADIYINVQGDEPLINPIDIKKIIKSKIKFPNEVINGYTKLKKDENPNNINIPKVIFNKDKYLIYISRMTIPGFKQEKYKPRNYYKQVCIYAFNRKELLSFSRIGTKSKIEKSEDIEILRFLEMKKKIRLVETHSSSLAVDEPKDIKKVEAVLKKVKKK